MTKEDGKPYHDPETGMFIMPDPVPQDTSGFRDHAVEMPSGEKKNILIPPAGLKPSRIFFAAVNGVSQTWNVEETVEEIKAVIDHAKSNDRADWYKFTEPIFGRDMHVPAISLQNVTGIIEEMTDLQKYRDAMAKEEYEKTEFRKFQLEQTARQSKGLRN